MAKTVRPGLRLLDRLILLVAWIATCGVVYLMGFYLGRGTQERHLHSEERVVRLPITSAPPAEGERPKTAGDLTFYEQMLSGGRAGGDAGSPAAGAAAPAVKSGAPVSVPQPTPPPPAAPAPTRVANAPAPASPPAPGGVPSAAPNLGVPAPLPNAARPAGTAAAPAAPAPVLATRPPAPSAVTPNPAAVERQTAPPTWPPPAKPVPVAPAIATVEAVPPPPAPRTSGGWTVEANPTRDRDEAEALQKRLRARGYDSTLVRVLRDGETWYRLHVGRYGSAEQASEMMRRLRDSEGIAHVFVATE